jgi:hypothetical protein
MTGAARAGARQAPRLPVVADPFTGLVGQLVHSVLRSLGDVVDLVLGPGAGLLDLAFALQVLVVGQVASTCLARPFISCALSDISSPLGEDGSDADLGSLRWWLAGIGARVRVGWPLGLARH